MKSIVLSERSLAQESEEFKNLIKEKINEENNEKVKRKKSINGTSDSKKSETQVQNPEKGGIAVQNGDKRCSKASFNKVNSETVKIKGSPGEESVDREYFLTDKIDTSAGIERNGLCSDKNEEDCTLEKNSSESEFVENSDGKNGSENVKDSESEKETKFVVEDNENSEDAIEIIEAKELGNSSKVTSDSSVSIDADMVEEIKLTHAKSKENVEPLEKIVLDLDENKENEKNKNKIILNNFSGSDLPNKNSGSCEIQVGKVETISDLEKESMWAEDKPIKCDKNSRAKAKDRSAHKYQVIPVSNEDSMNVTEGEKEDNHELEREENLVSECEEISEEEMNIEVEESNQMEEGKNEEKENEQTDLGNIQDAIHTTVSECENIKTNLSKSAVSLCRKRQIFKNDDEDPSAKKKKLSKDRKTELKKKNLEDSSRSESLSSLDGVEPSSKDQLSNGEAKKPERPKRNLTDGGKTPKKLNASVTNTPNKNRRTSKGILSILEKFRGTLKTLTRSDLEELIVQKLCEVITERSNVGELRQKAEALEQDQERWKTKAQSLTKQLREMDMVMRKYMSEVQKQIKEGETHVVTPLKVTRSVGLQVSFYSSTSKGPKQSLAPPVPTPVTPNTRNAKSSPPKGSSPSTQFSQNARNKPGPAVKVSPSVQKSPDYQQKRPIAPRPENSSSTPNRAVAQQTLPNNNSRGVQNQVQTQKLPGCKVVPGTSPQSQQPKQYPPQQQKQQQQQHSNQQKPQQNGSKIIDLTDDDDRQPGNKVRTPGTVIISDNKVVSHLPQPTQNNTFAYLLPTTSASAVSPVGQNRQVLIATPTLPQPNRPIMCPMPPLLFKGGNVVQTATPQMLNQSNNIVLPKTYKHPAPLPKRPVYQSTTPNLKLLPPRPALKISKVQTGIVLSWNMSLSSEHAPISSYQLFAYQESDSPPATSLWKKVGDVKALPLPMACTLTQFMTGHKYHFAVRAVDLHSRLGPFSFPGAIVLA